MQSSLSKALKDKTEILVWHDELINSLCRHKSNEYRPLSVPDLTKKIKVLQDKLSALKYCQRDRTHGLIDSLKELEQGNSIQVGSIVKDFISVSKYNNPDLLNQLNALHQILEIELENIDFI